jgi:hypothetical protein
VAPQKESKVVALRKQFEAAWYASGAEDRDGLPYLSRSALKAKLMKDGCTELTAEKKMRPGYPDQLIGALIVAEIISAFDHGWVVSNEADASALMLGKNKR